MANILINIIIVTYTDTHKHTTTKNYGLSIKLESKYLVSNKKHKTMLRISPVEIRIMVKFLNGIWNCFW